MAPAAPSGTARVSAYESYLASTIGKKQVMGLAGLGLCGFVLIHMIGNLLIFAGPEAYNSYSYKLIHNPLIYVAEIGLLVIYALHVVYAIQLTLRNRQARGSRTYLTTRDRKGVAWASRTMIQHGGLLFVFIAFHLYTFKYGAYYEAKYGETAMRDLYRLVLEEFKNPWIVLWYVVSMAALAYHLSHGFLSVFRTWGLDHPRYLPWIRRASYAFAILVAAGFISQPVYVYFFT